MDGFYQKDKIIRLESTISTNTYMNSVKSDLPFCAGTIVFAAEQTGGRGRGDNVWESEKGKNLTFSILLRPDFIRIDEQFLISKVVSLAIVNFLSKYTDYVSIKWPNDIYVKDKKIAGLLIENTLMGDKIDSMIIGIGININQETFCSNAPNPVSLKMITGEGYDLETCLENVCKDIDNEYIRLKSGRKDQIDIEYKNCMFRHNVYSKFVDEKETFSGRITGVDYFGRLCIDVKGGDRRIYSFGEIQFII